VKKLKLSITHKDEEMLELISQTDEKTLAVWALAADATVAKERNWQYQHLLEMSKKPT
jgi:hypothetical protein